MAVPTSGPFTTKTAGTVAWTIAQRTFNTANLQYSEPSTQPTVNTANRQHCPWTANPVIVCSLGNTCRAIQQLSLDLVARFVLTKG